MAQRSMMMVKRMYMQIGVVTLLTALVWTGVSVFLAINRIEIPSADKDILSPISATIDEATLKKISERVELSQLQSEVTVNSLASESAEATINEVTTQELPIYVEQEEVSSNSTQLEQGEL